MPNGESPDRQGGHGRPRGRDGQAGSGTRRAAGGAGGPEGTGGGPGRRRGNDGPLRASWDPESRATSAAGSARGARGRGGAGSAAGRPGGSVGAPVAAFFRTWGWRAYAIPVLLVLTIAVIADAVRTPTAEETPSEVSAQDAGGGDGDADHPGESGPLNGPAPAMGELPPGAPVLDAGAGTFHVIPGTSEQVGRPEGELNTFTIEVEDGINSDDFGGEQSVAQLIQSTLFDPKSWTADGKVRFERVADDQSPKFRITLTTPQTVREHCGFDIALETSCYDPSSERVYLNLARWVRGAVSFEGDLGLYRQYQINHEVGHAVGHPQHVPCPKEGALAPIMMQQTLSLTNADLHRLDPTGYAPDNDVTCRPNAWPFPKA